MEGYGKGIEGRVRPLRERGKNYQGGRRMGGSGEAKEKIIEFESGLKCWGKGAKRWKKGAKRVKFGKI